MASDFWELYKHPLWQKKRLEIMGRAEFCCEECGDDDFELNVHHMFYKKSAKPWEYENYHLRCLCKRCHEVYEFWKGELTSRTCLLFLDDQRRTVGYQTGRSMKKYPNIAFAVDRSQDYLEGVADAWGIPVYLILDELEESNYLDGNQLEEIRKEEARNGR
jgi:hypothetical protein